MKSLIKMKKIFIVWISIYPAITAILLLFGDELSIMPVFIRTLILTVVLVPLMVCILIPFWSKVFKFVFDYKKNEMKIYIKNMVCKRCKTVVRNELEKLRVETIDMSLGKLTTEESISDEVLFLNNWII